MSAAVATVQETTSVEEAIDRLKSQPSYESLVLNTYLDDDVVHAALRFARSEEFGTIATWATSRGIAPLAHVLDLGAGRGIASLAWALRGYEVTALEPDPSNLVGNGAIRDLIERTGVPITIQEQVGERMALEDASFDLVYVRQTLHHASDLQQMCREIARVLKPGGVLIATREHVVSNERQLPQFWANHPVHQLAGGEMAYELSRYRSSLRAAGFKRIRVYGPWDTVVNHFPSSTQDVVTAARDHAMRLCGKTLGNRLANLPYYHRLWSYLRTHTDTTPGRMYSFVATRSASNG